MARPSINSNRAKKAIAAYKGRMIRQMCHEDLRCTIVDLIADLIHYASDRNFNAGEMVETARMHARIEREV